MRIASVVAVAALTAASCASSDVRQCAQLSGLYEPGACHQQEARPLTDIRLPDGSPLAGVKQLAVEQTGCDEVRITRNSDAPIVLTLSKDETLSWLDDALVGGTSTKANGGMLMGAARSLREWRLRRSSDGNGLTYIDSREHRGMALLLVPFHERVAASCEWVRVSTSGTAAHARR